MELTFKIPFTNTTISIICDSPWNALSRYATIAASQVTVVALEALSSLCNLLGQKKCGHYLHYEARKIKATHIRHALAEFQIAPLPILTYAKNVARREVISREEDIKAIKVIRDRFIAQHPNLECTAKLQKSRCRGAHFDGICHGATLLFLKEYLSTSITSEEELIKIAGKFKNGFDAEAEALQALHKKTRFMHYEHVKIFEAAHADIIQIHNEKIALLKPEGEETIEKITADTLPLIDANLSKFYEDYFPSLHKVDQLAGLKIATDPKNLKEFLVDTFVIEETMKERFDNLPPGAYWLRFQANNGKHAACYIKHSFGSYFFDPNYGLMTTGGKTPAEALLNLLKSYVNLNREALLVLRYELI